MSSAPMPPLVSVIIPTYNRAELLPETLESVLSQTYPAIECIVVDDGSTDHTAEVVARLGEHVRLLRQPNQGVEAARCLGIQSSTGAYITFLDDDDRMFPHKVSRQVAVLEARPEAGVVDCAYRYIDADGHVLGASGRVPEGDMRRPLVWGCPPWSGGPLIRRECFEHLGVNDHRDWYGDWGMWLRITFAGYRWAGIQEPLGDYRIVPGSMIDNRISNCERLVFHILGEVFGKWRLPVEVLAEKDAIYAGWHFWLGCRYATMGAWTDARRNLSEALRRQPQWRQRPDELLQHVYADALSPRVRVHDPIRFVKDLFDHLPPELSTLAPFRDTLLSRVYTALSVRSYGAGRIEEAQAQLAAAVRLNPSILRIPRGLIKDVSTHIHDMPGMSPYQVIRAMFQNLPPEARPLTRAQPRMTAEITMQRAFRDYAAGQLHTVPRQILSALIRDPRWFKKRAVLTVFMKSLLGVKGGDGE